MQINQSATQLELDRIVDEVAGLWKLSYVACSGIIREYLVKAGQVVVLDGEKSALTMIPSPVLVMPDLVYPIVEDNASAPVVATEAFIEALTTAVQHIPLVPELEAVPEIEEIPELVVSPVTIEQVAITAEDDLRPCIPNVPFSADPTEKTTKSERIRQMFDQGMSVGKISRELKSNYSYVWAVVDTHKAVKARLAAEQEAAAQ